MFHGTTGDADPAIEIKFERSLPYGWSITRESESKVVYFEQHFTHNTSDGQLGLL